jgi:tRNA A-37 threonylcarbamoyl transferase component Bud32
MTTTAMEASSLFDSWWQRDGEWVEAPNLRRGGESGVQRLQGADGRLLYTKRQVGHVYRSLRHPFGRLTLLRERDALQAFTRLGVKVPRVVYCDVDYRREQSAWCGLLVSEELQDFEDIDSWYAHGGEARAGVELHEALLRQIGMTLARLHLGRWQHGCLYSKHIFVKVQAGSVEVALLDLEKSRRRLTRRRAALHDIRQLKRHSSWNDSQWEQINYGYERVFGARLEGCGHEGIYR